MISIELNDLRFFSFHGVHEEERILGNEFVVNAKLCYEYGTELVLHLDETIDYSEVFAIIRDAMDKPTPLLETLVTQMSFDIRQRFPQLSAVEIAIEKKRPPVQGWVGSATVKHSWQKS
jgi:dihydroneopterin aldolase